MAEGRHKGHTERYWLNESAEYDQLAFQAERSGDTAESRRYSRKAQEAGRNAELAHFAAR